MPPNTPLSPQEFKGLTAIAQARRAAMVTLFNGTKLRFGAASATGAGATLLVSGGGVALAAQPLISGAQTATRVTASGMRAAAEQFISTCAGVENIREVADVITSQATQNLIAEVAPVIGVVFSGVKMIQAGKAVAQDGHNLYKSKEYRTGFFAGDPVAAADSVTKIIKRDITVHSLDLVRNTGATAGKLAGFFVDMGTATTAGIGLANALADLGLRLYVLGQEIADMRAGNKRLAKPDDLDLTVFGDCPILGCYLLTCADTSQVGNFFIADIGLPNWQKRFELMKKTKMDPLLKIAHKAINSSRLQLEGLRSDKGTHAEKGFFARTKSKVLNLVSRSSPAPPKVDKSRIVGFGSS
jgi:hypothetical protein